ncbi:hypothetical protein EYC84_006175 [Monilinia fructicola]|uniref:C2H2-type domain-containing protein n=1 Tax=Monilinia fructicola TaxID=38448 RepID=A0A5M9K7G4_MONFR|nr:hypothetical protein EYC84_006175 [Monilinia fructicola]
MMAYYCYPCNRNFNSKKSYDQHIENSNAHRNYESSSDDEYAFEYEEPEYECDGCYASFRSTRAREQHHIAKHGDRYCKPCNRMFGDANQLKQHQRSKLHLGSSLECPFCPTQYPTASALIIHLESGTCSSGLNRRRINAEIRRLDPNHVITTRQIEYYSCLSFYQHR